MPGLKPPKMCHANAFTATMRPAPVTASQILQSRKISLRPFTTIIVFSSLLLILTLSGCGSLLGGDEVPTPTVTREIPPTFTPTPKATDTPELPTATAVPEVLATPVPATPTSEPTPLPEPTATVVDPTPTVAPTVELKPSLIISSNTINVRGGPGTAYAKVGVASLGETFEVIAKNEQGNWWQVCCFDGQPGWLFGDLVDLQNVDTVTVAEAIPAPPEPVATPVPAATAPPAPPASNLVPGAPSVDNSTTAGNLDPSAQYQIVNYHVQRTRRKQWRHLQQGRSAPHLPDSGGCEWQRH